MLCRPGLHNAINDGADEVLATFYTRHALSSSLPSLMG
jgi:hypothetical protein